MEEEELSSSVEEFDQDELYDNAKDDKDERFVQARRVSSVTDGTLSCPCCFTVLCYECQRHVEFQTQFRAITSVNVKIRYDKELKYEDEQSGKETYFPVACNVCGFEVAVFDHEETFHFFSVICSDPQ